MPSYGHARNRTEVYKLKLRKIFGDDVKCEQYKSVMVASEQILSLNDERFLF